MAKQIVKVEKVDLDMQTTEQMVERMSKRLSDIWGELDGKPEAQASVVAIWEQVQQLGNVNSELDKLVKVMTATLHEAVEQRDFAVIDAKLWEANSRAWEADAKGWEFDLKTWSQHGAFKAQEKLACVLAVATKLPVTDVARVLDDLFGDDESIDEAARDDFLDSFMRFANALYTEQTFRAYAGNKQDDES